MRCPKFRAAAMEHASHWAKVHAADGFVNCARGLAIEAAHEARSIWARRDLFARVIVATQAREGIDTTLDEARAAYDKIQEENHDH
jgi:hypothetical protein